MCLIMMREPNVTLDKVKFDTAVLNNPHGWGISIPDMEGQLSTFKEITTDKDELYDLIHGEFKSDKIMIHLRYTTAGDTVIRNAHPFPVLELGSDGVDMRVCHNGTLPRWSPPAVGEGKWESDTRRFVRGYVRPLMKRLIKGTTSEDLLSDPFVDSLLEGQLTTMSVLTLLDGYGNFSVVNEKGNGGFTDDDGTYYSNKYSHDPLHRVPTTYPQRGYQGNVGKTYGTTKGTTTQTPRPHTGVSPLKTKTGGTGQGSTDNSTASFMKKYELEDASDLHLMSDDTIQILCEDEPEDAALLIKELLLLHYNSERAVSSLSMKGKLKDRRISTLESDLKKKNNKETEDDKVVKLHA
jgi:predicted glutamine amidotransferase